MVLKKVVICLLVFIPWLVRAQTPSAEIPADSVKAYHIQEVNVSSKYYKRYHPKQMSEVLRLETSLLNLPQNIQVLDGEVFRDQVISNLNENVTRNVSGTFREELHNGISPDIFSRGGYISAQRNGVDLRPLGKGPIGDDVAIIDRVEFQKGPSSFMNAMSDPSGSFNIVTKKPTGETRRQVDFLTGSFGLLRAAVDMDGKLDSANNLQYRLNVMGMKTDGFLQHDRSNRLLFAPSLRYKLNKQSSLTVEYIYQQLNYLLLSEAQMSPYGFGTLPRDFTITDPSIRPFVGNDHNVFLTYQNRISHSWQLSTRLSYINSGYNGTLFWVNGKNEADEDILDRNLIFDSNTYNVFSLQTYVNGRFKTGQIQHHMLTGLDVNNKSSRSLDSWGTASAIYPLSISNPTYSNAVMNNGVGGDFGSENHLSTAENRIHRQMFYASLYAMDEMLFFKERIRVSLGLRLTASDGRSNDYGTETETKDVILTPRFGLSYTVDTQTALYFLHDQSYLPQSGMAADGGSLKPLRGVNYEIGLKRDWMDGRWNSTLAVYHIQRNRLVTTDPTSNLILQTGASISRGVEFDMKGQLAKGLHAVVNYAYTDSKISADELNLENIGLPTINRVRHIQNTWLHYQLPLQRIKGVTISAGYQWLSGRSERIIYSDQVPLRDFFRLDLGAGWSNEKYRINLMVNNVLDAKLYSTAWRNATNDMFYWVQLPPIHARLSLGMNL
ncbi:TonB-dependent siderophore receptor [Sphingobacterium paludis]|uniref:Iron complex outermembrane receptor protein n=1 Tax=Sphingobacterium paludis TaxID=1476465 RepID=A0A4R7D8T5_9SPHI|nr:TonB-dependent receptor plug domain-containing protein [Sphingobacterium paludis]TDS16224.1 iron complex outermembrane receptor protein [Sphingobacterium paludis]